MQGPSVTKGLQSVSLECRAIPGATTLTSLAFQKRLQLFWHPSFVFARRGRDHREEWEDQKKGRIPREGARHARRYKCLSLRQPANARWPCSRDRHVADGRERGA